MKKIILYFSFALNAFLLFNRFQIDKISIPDYVETAQKFSITEFGTFMGWVITVFTGLVSLPSSITVLYLWYLNVTNGQVPYFLFCLSRGFEEFPFEAIRCRLNGKKSFDFEELTKVRILNQRFYALNGLFKKLGLLSESKDSISKSTQFNLSAINYGINIRSAIERVFIPNSFYISIQSLSNSD